MTKIISIMIRFVYPFT